MSPLLEAMTAAFAEPLFYSESDLSRIFADPFRDAKTLSPDEQAAFVFEALEFMPGSGNWTLQRGLRKAVSDLLRSKPKISPEQALRMLHAVCVRDIAFPFKPVLNVLADVPLTAEMRDSLLRLRSVVTEWHGGGEMREIHARIDALLYGKPENAGLQPSGPWTEAVLAEVAQRSDAWRDLFLHARTLAQSSPSRKWLAEAAAHANAAGATAVLDAAGRWLALGPMPGAPPVQVPEMEATVQTGFLWTLGALGDASIAPALGDFACACFRKIPQIGAVCHRAGNACVNVLSAMPGLGAVSQLSRLSARVKYDVAQRLIEKALAAAAVRNNVRREDLEAMSVPSFGLDANGSRVEPAGDGEARLEIEGFEAKLTFTRNGKVSKSGVPAEFKKAAKELDIALASQRMRLERMLLSATWCPLENWTAWYLDHPLMRTFSTRLIWEVDCGGTIRTAIWNSGEAADWAGQPVALDAGARLRLWHPIRSDVQTVLAWRCRLEDDGLTQPFKQAHREVYLLTAAERETAVYSNRFAAHIVKQHQFAALCRERGWQFNLMGQWDSHNTPALALPNHGLRAELEVDFPEEEDEITAHAVYFMIRTGRFAFQRMDGQAVPLAEVPLVVFSEVMRDVDLFVGVASIGSDPSWLAARPRDPHAEHWRGFAFGELSEAAANRKAVLAALLPKLAIAAQCRIDDRYLCVRGKLNEYRIHLGSANVLIEPGSRNLCIVQGGSGPAVALPFAGDRILSVILSKAFLLTNDAAIRDPSIRSQIG